MAMIGLFSLTCVLIALTILSGLGLFFRKISRELCAFWILGASKDSIVKMVRPFITLLIFIPILLGLLGGTGISLYLKYYGPQFMPDVFVERSLPISFELINYFLSFSIPFCIGILVAYPSWIWFQRNFDFLKSVKST